MSEESKAPTMTEKEFAKQSKRIWQIGVVLMIAAAVSTSLATLTNLSTKAIIIGTLIVSAIQVTLQLFVFMHLKDERGFIYKFLLFTVYFVAAMFILTWLHHADPLVSKAISSK